MSMLSINPATEEVLASYDTYGGADVDAIVGEVQSAQRQWKRAPLDERCRRLAVMAELLRKDSEQHALLITCEMGKPIKQARAEIGKCVEVCEHYGRHASVQLNDRSIASGASESYVSFLPLGVLLGIMPWNFPFWQVFRFAVPSLTAGNAVLLKHASNVTGCALAIEELFRRAGYPDNLFRALVIPGTETGHVIAHPTVCAVSLTGSTSAGGKVAAEAGMAIKKTVLELGGSDPYIVLEDADLAKAAKAAATSRFMNTGQSCIAAKRLILEDPIADHFAELFRGEVEAFGIGDPQDEDTRLGPLAREDLRDFLNLQVKDSIDAGAKPVLGCAPLDCRGYYYPASILDEGKPGMPAFDDELFGPVALLVRASDEDEAIELANATRYGLGSSVWTRDIERGKRIAVELECGSTFINSMVRSDPRLPFGGIKSSGYGRELSEVGIREFVNMKTVCVGNGS